MNKTPNLLSPEREAEIREANARYQAYLARANPPRDESQPAACLHDLLTAYDAQREQFRQALVGLLAECEASEGKPLTRLKGTPPAGWSRECYCSGQQHQLNRLDSCIQAAAASLGIDLQDPL